MCSEAEADGIVEELDNVTLPPVQGAPVLVALARDSRTIFLYWSIDWPALFADIAPVDRQVHLRVYHAESTEQQSVAVEPLAGNCFVTVPQLSGSYRVEMGYYQPADVWHSISTSNQVMMPRDNFAAHREIDLATIPLHLNFQTLLDLFGAANGAALAEIVSQFQARALTRRRRKSVTAGDHEILREMNLSLEEIAAARRAFMTGKNEAALGRLARAILSSESASPLGGFSPCSW